MIHAHITCFKLLICNSNRVPIIFWLLSSPSTSNKKVRHFPLPLSDLPTDPMLQVDTMHVLLVVDVQLADPHVLAHSESLLGIDYIAELSREVYVRRAWCTTCQLHPHVVLFLGDMLKSGCSVQSDNKYVAPPPPSPLHSLTHTCPLADSRCTSSTNFLCICSSRASRCSTYQAMQTSGRSLSL